MFCYDNEGMYCQDSTCIMTGSNLKFLCAYMNSRLGRRLLHDNAPQTGTGDLLISVQAVEPLLAPPITPQNRFIVDEIETLVDRIIDMKQNSQDTIHLKNRIDQLVYRLYGLTEEEIKIVAGETE